MDISEFRGVSGPKPPGLGELECIKCCILDAGSFHSKNIFWLIVKISTEHSCSH